MGRPKHTGTRPSGAHYAGDVADKTGAGDERTRIDRIGRALGLAAVSVAVLGVVCVLLEVFGSVSGASNVIKNHGVQFTDDIDKLNRSINEAGIVYLHAQLFAKAMKFVGPIRKALQFPTVFNLLGPLVNPSQPKCQLLGVANLDQMRLYNQVYQKLGIDFGIVNSIDGYDEISLTGDFKVTTNNYEKIFKPQGLGFEIAKPEEVRGGATEEEAKDIFDAVLENRALPAQKNIVLANAAFGIQVMEKGQKSIEECVEIARESIDSGKALATFKKFVEINS